MPEATAPTRGSGVWVGVQVDIEHHDAWRDGLETFTGIAAELLAEHHWREGQATCQGPGCDWAPTAVEAEERRRQHCEHQAQVLPAIDLHPWLYGEHAAALHQACEARRAAEGLEREAVLAAHGAGWSWTRIADALGLSAATVHRRYRGQVPAGRWPDRLAAAVGGGIPAVEGAG